MSHAPCGQRVKFPDLQFFRSTQPTFAPGSSLDTLTPWHSLDWNGERPMTPRPVLYIIDVFALIFQVFHATTNREGRSTMHSPTQEPTNAVHGVFRDVLNLIRDKKPDYLAAAFDGPGPVFRSKIDPSYKSQRAETPTDLIPQIDVVKRVYEGFNVPVLIHEGSEADDIIATLARRGVEQGFDVVICTADKDARQLLNENIRIYNIRKKEYLDESGLLSEWGIRPDQVVDLLALTGDTADNVPGIPGIGLKTGATLLQEFGTLEGILANIGKVSGVKRKENLQAFGDIARRGQTLIRLQEDLELGLNWDELKLSDPNSVALRELCRECGFQTFLAELPGEEQTPEAAWAYEYKLVDTPDAFESFLEILNQQTRFSVDTETTSIDPLRAKLVGLSFSWANGEGYYIPVRAPLWTKSLDEEMVLTALKPILANSQVEKIGQNLKYDMLVLSTSGIEVAGPITDTMVLSYLLESGEKNHNLNELASRYLGHTMIPISDLIGKGKKQSRMDEVEPSRVAEYAGEDADAAWQLAEILAPKLREAGLWDLYADLERPLIRILAGMEAHGVKVDVKLLKKLSVEFAARIVTIEAAIFEAAGRSFNIASTNQLRQVLFDELKLPSKKKTPGGEPSTDQEVLEELAAIHPLPKLLIEHRQLSKLKNTYLDSLPTLVHPNDGRVHASFNQVVTSTGRLSSSDPNLQNIPVRTEDGRQIRQAFIAGQAGWKLLTADYSQIELRILAHYSKDPALVRAFAEDRDVHSVVAAEIFAVSESEVTSAMRGVAKTVNFGVIYGLSSYGLATRLSISRTEASAFIDAYFERYAGVMGFIRATLTSAKLNGRVETILGRRRMISGIKSTEQMIGQPERFAVNTVIQGSAADLIKKAMIAVDRAIKCRGLQARLLLQIHDELVFEAPEHEIPELRKLVEHEMTTAMELDVPLKVEIGVGDNWLDVE